MLLSAIEYTIILSFFADICNLKFAVTNGGIMAVIIDVDDINIPELSIYTHLTDARLRKAYEYEHGIFIAESQTVIEVALDSGCKPISLFTDRRYINERASKIIERCGDITVYAADKKLMSQLTGYELTRGMLCAMQRPAPKSVEELCSGAKRIAVLENIADVSNAGAIIRSAAALGIDAVLITPSCCDPLCRRAIRVSMGTVFLIPWGYIGEDEHWWQTKGPAYLNSLGFRTAAMALDDNSVSVDDPVLKSEEKLAIILGSEGYGLSRTTIENCDYTVKIPMYHGVDSLNVGAAAAVAFWELRNSNGE